MPTRSGDSFTWSFAGTKPGTFTLSGPSGELLTQTLTPGADNTLSITVAGTFNTLAQGVMSEGRLMTFDDGSGNQLFNEYVVILPGLIVLGNSFQTYPEAIGIAGLQLGLTSWPAASMDQRVAAMSLAYTKLAVLRYDLSRHHRHHGAASSEWSPPAGWDRQTFWDWRRHDPIEDITRLPLAAFQHLRPDFLRALKLAQILEADDLLTNATSGVYQIDDNLLSRTVGDVTEQYKATKNITKLIARTTQQVLGPYIDSVYRLTRV